jgi:hypothetical protein
MGNGGEGAFSLGFKIAQWMEPCEDATRLVALGIVVLERRWRGAISGNQSLGRIGQPSVP